MTEKEIIEVFRSCQRIRTKLHEKRYHALTEADQNVMRQIKVLWKKDLIFYQPLMDIAGITLEELAFVGNYLYRHQRAYIN